MSSSLIQCVIQLTLRHENEDITVDSWRVTSQVAVTNENVGARGGGRSVSKQRCVEPRVGQCATNMGRERIINKVRLCLATLALLATGKDRFFYNTFPKSQRITK